MAINYANLFATIGKVIKTYNAIGTQGQLLPSQRDEIIDKFDLELQFVSQEGLATAFDGYTGEYRAVRSSLSQWTTRRLQDVSLLNELGLSSNSIGPILSELFVRMLTDSQSVNGSVVTIGATSANLNTSINPHHGNGTILTTKKLSAIDKPSSSSQSIIEYASRDSELCLADTLYLDCTGDSYSGNSAEGAETFSVSGLATRQRHDPIEGGNGQLGSVQAMHASRLLQNADFETWTLETIPDGWVSATAIALSNAGGSGFHGDNALVITGDGALKANVLQFPTGALKPGATYCASVWLKGDSGITNGEFYLALAGTGFTPGASEKVLVAAASIPITWTQYSFFVVMPAVIPADIGLHIRWGISQIPTSGKSIMVDDIGLTRVSYFGGIGIVPVRGSIPFIVGDRYTIGVTAVEGVIQKFFRQVYGVQLPSNLVAGESIDDAVAV
jgi:hypothetical protein